MLKYTIYVNEKLIQGCQGLSLTYKNFLNFLNKRLVLIGFIHTYLDKFRCISTGCKTEGHFFFELLSSDVNQKF